jgi:hypothetical protein
MVQVDRKLPVRLSAALAVICAASCPRPYQNQTSQASVRPNLKTSLTCPCFIMILREPPELDGNYFDLRKLKSTSFGILFSVPVDES